MIYFMLKDKGQGIEIDKGRILEGLEALYGEMDMLRATDPKQTCEITARELANLYGVLILMAEQLGWDEKRTSQTSGLRPRTSIEIDREYSK